MLKIFIGDAWLASWIFLENFVSNSLKRLCKTCTKCHIRFIKSVNRRKRILYSCNRNMLQTGNVNQKLSLLVNKLIDNLKEENYSAIHFLRKWFVFELCFPSNIVGARLYVAMASWLVEYVINKN